MSTEATYEDLVDALGRPGCAICRLATRRADRFLGSYIYEHVNDVDLRANIREARGFCEVHAGHFLEKLDALAVAITYRDILNTLVKELEGREAVGRDGSTGMRARLRGLARAGSRRPRTSATCPVCEAEGAAAGRALDVLTQHGDQRDLDRALLDGDPLCLPHAREALRRRPGFATLGLRQQRGWSALRDRLLEFIRKSDHNYRWETLTDEERAAIVGGVRAVTGIRARPRDDAKAETRKLRRGGTNAVRSERHSPRQRSSS
ncbi:MAG: DUF6062 family protein [Chloroflexota bacterium]|nr:DUF6062 family protein [Chloroflexota bacterium]MDE2921230.1 DUF6062 family protein [Chloroflexota bacterium]